MKIICDPNPILRMPTRKVTDFDMTLQETIDAMVKTMRDAAGVGLAAPQVGILNQIIVLENQYDKNKDAKDNFPLTIIVNPEIKSLSRDKCLLVEGCLSFPDIRTVIKRPRKVTVKGKNRWGKPIQFAADGFLGRALQHEIDHLDGILLIDHITKLKTVLMSNMDLGLPAMHMLKEHPQFDLMALMTKRQTEIKHSLVNMAEEAKKIRLPVIIWKNEEQAYRKLKDLKPDLIIVAGFGKIISERIIDIPKYGTLNIHPSLLPKYRGPSPVQFTILGGEKETGVTIIKLVKEVDAGPIIGQGTVKLPGNETSELLLKELAMFGAELLIDIIPYYIANDSEIVKQDHNKATFTRVIRKEDGEILPADTPEIIERKVRAFHNWPIVYTYSSDRRVQILKSHLDNKKRLIIDKVRPEGKKIMTYAEFKRGYKKPLKNLKGKLAT